MAALLTIIDTPTNSGLGDPAPTAFNKCNAVITAVNTIYATDPRETAKAITPTNPMWPFLDARRYGIDMTGATDSTVAMQRAHSMGLPVNYPPGLVQFSAITMPGGGIVGAGIWQTTFQVNQTTANAITVNYNGSGNPVFGPTFSGFNFTATSAQTSGYFIIIDPVDPTAQNNDARFYNLRSSTSFIWGGIYFAQAFGWNIIGCEIGAINNAIFIDNTVNADAGVASIVGGVVSTAAGGTCIHQVASGGLKVTGLDILGGDYGFLFDLSNTGNTSDLLFANCSIEGQAVAGIQLQRQAGSTKTFKNVSIVGCEFEPRGYAIYTNDSSGFLSNLTIIGCTSDGFAGSNGFYIDYVDNVCVEGNAMQAGAGGVGCQFGTHNTKARFGPTNSMDYTTSLIPGNAKIIPGDLQTGTTTITTSATLGSLFSNTATITFATAFAFAPNLADCNVAMTTAGSGNISATVVSVTATQLVVQAVGTTNSTAVPVTWSVWGVI